jgi:hypothetical protein
MEAISSSQTEFLFALDTPQLIQISPTESYLKGWFVAPKGAGNWNLSVAIDNREEPVYTGFLRPDVRRHLGSHVGGRSGFVARIPSPAPGQRISLTIQMDGIVRELIGDIGQEQRSTLRDASSSRNKVSSYQDWLFECEPRLFQTDLNTAEISHRFSYRPKISLLAEFHEHHIYFLDMFLRSLSAQLYSGWQLCIAGDLNADSETFRRIERFAATDSRVTLLPSAPAADPSQVWNAALEAADGDFVAELRLCDELHPFALLEIVAALQDKEAHIVYSDEDQVDLFGRRCRPEFKPDFDGERLLSTNYIGRLTAVRRSLGLRSGGFRSLPRGAREWDFLLRCVEQIQKDEVAHVTKPLYHLRTQEALADSGVSLAYAEPDDLCHVIRDHVTRAGKQAIAQIGYPTNTIRLQYQSPKDMGISIFLRDEDGIFQVAALAELVNKYRVEFYGILNGMVHRLPDPQDRSVPMLRPPLVSFADITSDVLIFINRPIDSLNHFFLQDLVSQAARPDCGVVTGLSVDLAGQFIHTGFIREDEDRCSDPFAGTSSRVKGLGRHVRVTRSVSAISDDFFAVRREYVEAVGGFEQLSSSRMPQFVRALTRHAHHHGLKIIVTPYSVGAFDYSGQFQSRSGVISLSDEAVACFNPNLSAFSDPYALLQA